MSATRGTRNKHQPLKQNTRREGVQRLTATRDRREPFTDSTRREGAKRLTATTTSTA